VLVVYRHKRNKKKAKIKGGCCENIRFFKGEGDRKFSVLKVRRLCPLVLLVRVR
jgi:hypothetical protein